MNIIGLSGDTICIQDNYIIKICNSNQNRFIANIQKQKNFNSLYIKAIDIIETGIIDNKQYIKMPFLKCLNSLDYLSISNIIDVQYISNIFIKYFKHLITNSCKNVFDYNNWLLKLDDILNKINDTDLIKIINKLKLIKFNNLFYYGPYHGDLTLSNLFFIQNENKIDIEVFDFLKSFIETPLLDIVKIRQDTKHLWSLNLHTNNLDFNKIVLNLDYLDNQIKKFINNDPILIEYYIPFQIINLLRILPYNKNKTINIYLKQEIIKLYNEL